MYNIYIILFFFVISFPGIVSAGMMERSAVKEALLQVSPRTLTYHLPLLTTAIKAASA